MAGSGKTEKGFIHKENSSNQKRLIYILIKLFSAKISAVKGKLSDQKYHPFKIKPTNNAFALLKFIYGVIICLYRKIKKTKTV